MHAQSHFVCIISASYALYMQCHGIPLEKRLWVDSWTGSYNFYLVFLMQRILKDYCKSPSAFDVLIPVVRLMSVPYLYT